MKYVLLLSFFVVSITCVAQHNDEQDIRTLMANQETAWNKGDVDAFMLGYWNNDSLLFVGSKGPAYGWKTTLEGYKKRYPDTTAMGKLQFTILELRLLSDDDAFVLGKWHLSRTIGDIGGYFTLLFRKINGKWYIVSDHTS